jgi:hypothetical protein
MLRFLGFFWKTARVGERLSPYVSLCCIAMAVSNSFSFMIKARIILIHGANFDLDQNVNSVKNLGWFSDAQPASQIG